MPEAPRISPSSASSIADCRPCQSTPKCWQKRASSAVSTASGSADEILHLSPRGVTAMYSFKDYIIESAREAPWRGNDGGSQSGYGRIDLFGLASRGLPQHWI